MSRLRRHRRGMSLVETMIVLGILVFMSLVTYAVIDATIETRAVLAERDETTRGARVTMARLRRELQLAYLTTHLEAVNTYQTVFVGLDENPDRLYFATLSHQRLYRDSRESDQAEVTVWGEPSEDRRGYTLFHREGPRIDEEPDEDGVIYPLAYHVRTFNLRYLDPQTAEWVDEWDTRTADQANRLPRAVQIGMVLVAEEEQDGRTVEVDIPFMTTILLQYSTPLQNPEETQLPPPPP